MKLLKMAVLVDIRPTHTHHDEIYSMVAESLYAGPHLLCISPLTIPACAILTGGKALR